MRFEGVSLAGLAIDLPERRIRSEELETRLEPIYRRLGLSIGRLELMSGIQERRHYPPGTPPSRIATRAAERALAAAGIERSRIGFLAHTAVCRDFLEPATACRVHQALGLSEECPAFDLSNACLGFLNGLVEAAIQIQAGRIEAALVVSGEDGGPLVEATLRHLLTRGDEVTKQELKLAMASLTIGSGGAAAVLTRQGLGPARANLVACAQLSDTSQVELCQGDRADGLDGPLMSTNSEALLVAGVGLAQRTFPRFLEQTGWSAGAIEHFVTHQVGRAHKRALFEALKLRPERDHPTLSWLGNVGSASLPLSLALALESGALGPGQRVALLGIGSGLQCLMLGLELGS